MGLIKMDRNDKWRLNDLVFTKSCQICGIKVEWQHEDPVHNSQNNFHRHLYSKGWKLKYLGLFQPRGWCCELHE